MRGPSPMQTYLTSRYLPVHEVANRRNHTPKTVQNQSLKHDESAHTVCYQSTNQHKHIKTGTARPEGQGAKRNRRQSHSSMPYLDPSRPSPLSFMPPNGPTAAD